MYTHRGWTHKRLDEHPFRGNRGPSSPWESNAEKKIKTTRRSTLRKPTNIKPGKIQEQEVSAQPIKILRPIKIAAPIPNLEQVEKSYPIHPAPQPQVAIGPNKLRRRMQENAPEIAPTPEDNPNYLPIWKVLKGGKWFRFQSQCFYSLSKRLTPLPVVRTISKEP